MLTKFNLSALLAVVTLWVTTAAAVPGAAPVAKDAMATDESWHFNVAPYLWAIAMNGTEQVATRRAHIDESFSEIWQQMNWGGMLWLDANKGRLGIFFNGLYAVLSDGANQGPFSVNVKVNFGIFGAGASYEVYRYIISNTSSVSIEPYVGARYTVNNTRVQFNISTIRFSDQKSNNQNWTDPIVGARVRYDLTKAWQLLLAGDIGGTNASSQYSYNAMGLIGYSPQTILTSTTIYAGYRVLDQHYVTGSGRSYFNWNMKLTGPLLGVMVSF